MNAEIVTQIIQMILAPTVMVSACTLIQSGILGRYSNIGNRLRALVRDRAEFLADDNIPIDLCRAGLGTIDVQLLNLSRRHRLIQNTILTLYSAVLLFLSAMIAIAIAEMLNVITVAIVALVLFLIGTGLLLVGVILASLEVRMSHQAVHTEVKWVMTLVKPI